MVSRDRQLLAPLVFITGAPGAGKSSLARTVAERIKAPIIFKDGIKESLYDQLVAQGLFPHEITRPLTERLSAVACAILFEAVLEFPSEVPVLIEGDFRPDDLPSALHERGRPMVELHCKCDRQTRLRRHTQRALVDRHVVHCDDESTAELLRDIPDSVFGPHGFGAVHVVDTTLPVRIDALINEIGPSLTACI